MPVEEFDPSDYHKFPLDHPLFRCPTCGDDQRLHMQNHLDDHLYQAGKVTIENSHMFQNDITRDKFNDVVEGANKAEQAENDKKFADITSNMSVEPRCVGKGCTKSMRDHTLGEAIGHGNKWSQDEAREFFKKPRR